MSEASETPTEQASTEPTSNIAAPDSAAQKMADLEAQLKEQSAKYLYLYAEFENYKKRLQKERSDLLKFGWESAARDLLQIVDNFERAMEHAPETTDKNLIEGLKMILTQFGSTLEKQGIQKIETAEKAFDPNLHEAIGQEPSPLPSGSISKELLKGYTLHGRLLRPSRVVLSLGNSNGTTE